MKVGIIGYGYVGKAYNKIFKDAVIYDEPLKIGNREEINKCDMALVCVPTPSLPDGNCDTSIVSSVVEWLETPLILIKSAIKPGTTDRLKFRFKKRIVVSPEYVGESKYYIPDRFLNPSDPLKHEFIILGGDDEDCEAVADIFAPLVGAVTRIRFMKAIEAEIVKYAENSFFATKVMFANELREICEAYGASWHRVREGWIDDPRVGVMHTAVFPNDRGYDGKCYPKDTIALMKAAEEKGIKPYILRATIGGNKKYGK
jgi:UDPglucose 6-dehydrogenase